MFKRRPKKPSLANLKAIDLDYDAYWRHRVRDRLQSRYAVIAGEIESGSSILDVGCGDGANLAFLVREKEARGVGIDISQKGVEAARDKGLTAFVQDIAAPEWQLADTYDYIVISEVLEHVPCPERVIQKVQDRFRHKLLITVPNIGYYPYRLQLLKGNFPVQWGYHPGEHLRFWSVADFQAWVKNFDLALTNILPIDGFPFLYKYFPNLFGHQILYVLQKA